MITDFYRDPSYVNISVVKHIGIDKDINSIVVGVNHNLVSATIHLDNFSEKTIAPLRKELAGLLLTRHLDKETIINSIITCIHQNIDCIKSSQPEQNKAKGKQEEKDSKNKTEGDNNNDNNVNNAQILVNLASLKHNTELFFKDQYGEPYVAVRLGKDQYGEPYVAVRLGKEKHLEIMSLESRKYKYYLARLFRENTGGQIVGKEAINSTVNVLSANAEFDGETVPLHLRVAWGRIENKAREGYIYYDMTDQQWRIIEISKYGWQIISGSDTDVPILFKRYNQVAQVEPDRNYSIDIFDQFLNLTNVRNKKHKHLLKVYIVSLLIPDIDHTILTTYGPKGAAKSFLLELIKKLIDPSKPTLLTLQKNIAEFIQQVNHIYLPFYDNVKFIPYWLSDEICKAITGIGHTKRKLYSNNEDFIYEHKRCISLNGINVALTEPDALDRSIFIELQHIDDEDRRKEEELIAEFERIRPKLMGYIFDVLVKAMQIKPKLRLTRLSRMADFTEWGEAISQAIGYQEMSFIEAYQENRNEQNRVAVNENIVGSLFVKFYNNYEETNENPIFVGSPEILYKALVDFAEGNEININNRQFPKTSEILIKKLNAIKSNLKEGFGIIVKIERDSRNYSTITIYRNTKQQQQTTSNPLPNQAYALQVLHKQILR
jgi:hypothetical protein